ncbi:unnamed protein product [Alopecurus aequalis]
MAATMKLPLTIVVLLLLSVLVVFGDARHTGATCGTIRCIQGGNITCENHEGVIQGCSCVCAPKHGKGCVLHLQSGSEEECDTKNC